MTSPVFESEILTSELPEAVFLEDLDGNILDVNDRACELLGYEREELLELTVDDLVPEGEPAFLPGQIDEATRSGEPLESVNLDKEGNEIPVELRGKLCEIEGNERMLATVRDITERVKARNELEEANEKLKRSKERYQSYFEELGDAVFIAKVGGENHARILDANKAAEHQTGYSHDELIGMRIHKDIAVEPPDSMEYETADKKLRKGETITFTEKKRRKNGIQYWTEVLVTPIEYQGETASLSINRDVTERKEAERALNEERDKLKNLHEAVDLLQQQDSEKDVLETAVKVAEKMLDFEICAIDLVEGDYLTTKATSAELDLDETTKYKKGEGIAGKTLKTGQTIWGDDLKNQPDAKPTSGDFRAYISVPIGDLGTFQVVSEEAGKFNQQDVELAEILVGHIKEEIERVRLEEELRQHAIHDPLTGLYNRRHFNVTLGKEVERCARYGHNIAFIMIDVNRFKEINDHYSHQTGDEVLQAVADLLQSNVRDADTVVRYGGDEFLIMMPETAGEAKNTVDRLKNKIDEWNDDSSLLDFPLTLAMGVSHWSPDQDRDVKEALKEADQRMYKEKGR